MSIVGDICEERFGQFVKQIESALSNGACCDCHLHHPDDGCELDCKPGCVIEQINRLVQDWRRS